MPCTIRIKRWCEAGLVVSSCICVAVFVSSVLLFYAGSCSQSFVKDHLYRICSVDFCLEYISTFIMMCKYGDTEARAIVWVLYYALLSSTVILHWIAVRHSPLCMLFVIMGLTIISALGISLVFQYNSQQIEVIISESRLHAYTVPSEHLHALGVFLFFGSNVTVHFLIWLQNYSLKRKGQVLKYLLLGELFEESFYIVAIVAFLSAFVLHSVVAAIFLEYVVAVLYLTLFLTAVSIVANSSEKDEVKPVTYFASLLDDESRLLQR